MKPLLLAFFSFTSPLLVFLATALHGGISNEVIKTELASANIYEQLLQHLASISEETEDTELQSIIIDTFTPQYTKMKIENTIDVSYFWIIGDSREVPTISFPEIKEKLITNNPDLLAELETLAEKTNQPVRTEGMGPDEIIQAETLQQQTNDNLASFTSLVKNDFTISLEKHLASAKLTYNTIKIILPILLILLLLDIILLGFLNKTWSSRLRWIGATILTGGLIGYLVIFLQNSLVVVLTDFAQENSSYGLSIFSPVIIALAQYFVETYTTYQGIISTLFLIMGVLFILLSLLGNKTFSPHPVNTLRKK